MEKRMKEIELVSAAVAAIAAAALVAGCLSDSAGDDNDTGEGVECGDYGDGETNCEDVADNILTCCSPDLMDQCETESVSWENTCGSSLYAPGVLEHCSCDDCEEHGDDECLEFFSCLSACGFDSSMWAY